MGGWVGGVLITSLWTFICMMISFCSLLPQYHVTQRQDTRHLCISSFIHFHTFLQSLIHPLIHSFIHSFIFSAVQAACTAEEATCTSNRDQFSACTIEGNSACTAEAPPPFGHPKDPHTFSKRDLEPPGACITVNIQSPSQKILCGPIGIPKAYHRHTIGLHRHTLTGIHRHGLQ